MAPLQTFGRAGLIVLLIITLFSTSISAAPCNQTVTVSYRNESLASSNYTSVVTEVCAPASDNIAFGVAGGGYSVLTILLFVIIVFAKQHWLKVFLASFELIMVNTLLRMTSIFVEITAPEQITLIALLNTFFRMFVILLWPMVAICIFVAVVLFIQTMREVMTRRKEKEWEIL